MSKYELLTKHIPTFERNDFGEWFVDKKYPVEIIIDPEDSRKITLSWREGYSG